ncbi:O-acyltransferase WSD1, partial [Quillaja saponaria]
YNVVSSPTIFYMMDLYNEEEVTKPMSPSGQFLEGTMLCLYIIGVLEFEVPIDDTNILSPFIDHILSINSQFSSIVVADVNGVKKWKKVEVKLEEHIKAPNFPTGMSPKSYDEYLDEYLCRKSMEQSLQNNKPLWEIHMINYPTSRAAGSLIFKLHHALGDGYSIMGGLLSCAQRVDNPSLPLSFPSRRPVSEQELAKGTKFRRLPSTLSLVMNTITDFGWSQLKSCVIADDKTPIRSGDGGVEVRPISITNILLSLDHLKEIKNNLGVTLNDVICGIVFLGIRLYMQEINYKSRKACSTALMALNTRTIENYQSMKDMMKDNTKGALGNQFTVLHVPIPGLGINAKSFNPLQFILHVHQIIKKKRHSLAFSLNGWILKMLNKYRGHEAAARHFYNTIS